MDDTTDEQRAAQLRFLAIDERTGIALCGFRAIVEPELPRILDAFYRHSAVLPQVAGIVGQQVPRLKQAQTARAGHGGRRAQSARRRLLRPGAGRLAR